MSNFCFEGTNISQILATYSSAELNAFGLGFHILYCGNCMCVLTDASFLVIGAT